jgi:hypothetical protein
MKKFFLWLASFIEDKQGSISSKRVGFIFCLFLLKQAMYIPDVEPIIVYTIAGLAFGLAGLTIPEWFSTINTTKTSTSIETKTTANN